MVFCGVRLQHGRGDLSRIRAMNPDRHIYLTTVVLAAVFATAINVLKPREPFAGTTMHRETTALSRTAEASPQTVEVSARAPAAVPQRAGASL